MIVVSERAMIGGDKGLKNYAKNILPQPNQTTPGCFNRGNK